MLLTRSTIQGFSSWTGNDSLGCPTWDPPVVSVIWPNLLWPYLCILPLDLENDGPLKRGLKLPLLDTPGTNRLGSLWPICSRDTPDGCHVLPPLEVSFFVFSSVKLFSTLIAASTNFDKLVHYALAVMGVCISFLSPSSKYLHLSISSTMIVMAYLTNSVYLFSYSTTVIEPCTNLKNPFLFASQKDRG